MVLYICAKFRNLVKIGSVVFESIKNKQTYLQRRPNLLMPCLDWKLPNMHKTKIKMYPKVPELIDAARRYILKFTIGGTRNFSLKIIMHERAIYQNLFLPFTG